MSLPRLSNSIKVKSGDSLMLTEIKLSNITLTQLKLIKLQALNVIYIAN